jgi:hypothetical protein
MIAAVDVNVKWHGEGAFSACRLRAGSDLPAEGQSFAEAKPRTIINRVEPSFA